MKTSTPLKGPRGLRQRGAVAILFGLSIFVLFGFMALAIDLGRTYVVRTELQNAADAAALAGAKQLNQTAAGVCCGSDSAVSRAIAIAAQNNFNFVTPVTITSANISVGTCPDDGCMVLASSVTTNPQAVDKTFLKVDIPSGALATFFAVVPTTAAGTGTAATSTFGRAVAGRFVTDVTPLAICKLNDTAELGYERGVSYKISDANPIGPGTSYWIDPESSTPGVCSNTSASNTLPYVCTGKIKFTPQVGQTVNTNTGVSDPQLEALDSRFGVFNSKNKCDANTAPPDTNIREYRFDDLAAGSPRDWMTPDPTRQSILFFRPLGGQNLPVPTASRTFLDYGVLWSASRPQGATVSQWPTLYAGGAAQNYPEPSPYTRDGGSGRRFLNMVIVECTTSGGNCRPATVKGIGKFFMQRKANVPGDKNVYVEFAGLIDPVTTAEIKLYR